MTSDKQPPWPRVRLKYVVDLRRDRAEGSERPYVGLEQIESATGRLTHGASAIRADEAQLGGEAESVASAFEPGDVLFGKLRPYLAKAWLATFSGRCTTELLVMRPTAMDPGYLRYFCLSRQFVDAIDASTFGSKMPRAEWDMIGSMPIPSPPLAQQHWVVSYLDRELTRVDALIAAKERLLALLAEKRRALITQAVTHGIDPRAPLRDSVVPWLGDIPAHWEVERSRWLFQERDERSTTGEEELLTVSHLTGVTRRSDKDVNMFEAETTEGYKICRTGDLVINTLWAWMGAMGVAPLDGIVSPAYNVYVPSKRIDAGYLDALVRTPVFAQEV